MIKIPNEHRLTEKNVRSKKYLGDAIKSLVTDELAGSNGYFFLPKEGKPDSMYYLCRLVTADGWYCLAINIPTEGRTPTWEEQHYVKNFFFDKDDVLASFHPGQQIYLGKSGSDNKYWVHLWMPQKSWPALPPLFENPKLQLAGFWKKFFLEIKRMVWQKSTSTKTSSREPSSSNESL
jgi:hypothetical protein